jgi:hypothetical protein
VANYEFRLRKAQFMTPENSTENDPNLRKVLREWEVKEPLPPRFREHVWQRIARREASPSESPWVLIANWVGGLFARPSLAVSYVTVLLAAGMLAGYLHARADTTRMSEELGARYVQMLDPYQGPHR